MNFFIISIMLLFLTTSCSTRTVVEGEILLSERVYEENGYYYDLSPPNTKVTYTGTCIFYHHDTGGQKKGTATVLNGLPHGIWKYWDVEGNFEYALHFDNGKLVKRELP